MVTINSWHADLQLQQYDNVLVYLTYRSLAKVCAYSEMQGTIFRNTCIGMRAVQDLGPFNATNSKCKKLLLETHTYMGMGAVQDLGPFNARDSKYKELLIGTQT